MTAYAQHDFASREDVEEDLFKVKRSIVGPETVIGCLRAVRVVEVNLSPSSAAILAR